MSKGYAFGFLIILLVLVLGFYVAFTGFMSSRDALRAQPTLPSATKSVQATRVPTSPAPTATLITIPTPVSGITATLTAMVSTVTTEPPPAPTSPPAEALPTMPPVEEADTPAPVVQPPTATPAPLYQFRLAGPPSSDPNYPNCCYIRGMVRDAAGNGLEGVQVQAFNEWDTKPPAITKGGGEAGQYDIPIGPVAVTWNLVILDAAGNRISPQVPVQFDGNVTNAYRVDWQRGY
jgi:hypothetical protein